MTTNEDRSAQSHGYAYAFRGLLQTHPDIEELIADLARRKPLNRGRCRRESLKEIHERMLMALRAKGLTCTDYPFSTQTLARSSLRRFVHEIRYGNFKQVAQDCTDNRKSNIAGAGNLAATCTVRGNKELGRRAYVQFMGVRYSSVRLANTPSMIEHRIVLSVDKNNLQKITAYLENGQYFDCLEPLCPTWRVPHTYEFRRQFLRKCRKAHVPEEIFQVREALKQPNKVKG